MIMYNNNKHMSLAVRLYEYIMTTGFIKVLLVSLFPNFILFILISYLSSFFFLYFKFEIKQSLSISNA